MFLPTSRAPWRRPTGAQETLTHRPFFGIILICLCACGGQAAQQPPALAAIAPTPNPVHTENQMPPWFTAEGRANLPSDTFVVGVGVHEELGKAQAIAEAALSTTIWAKSSPTFALPTLVHDNDVRRSATLNDGRYVELVAVEKAMMSDRLLSWLQQQEKNKLSSSDANTPEGMLGASLSFLKRQERRRAVCLARTFLANIDCKAPDAAMAKKQVYRIGSSIRFESVFPDGVPVLNGKPVRDIAVRASWEDKPWAGLPIRFENIDAKEAVLPSSDARASTPLIHTNAEGIAVWSVDHAQAGDTVYASIARDIVVGHDSFWPPLNLTIGMRDIDQRGHRLAMGCIEFVEDEKRGESTTRNKTMSILSTLGHKNTQAISPDYVEALSKAHAGNPATLRTVLSAIADAHKGGVDMVVYCKVRSEFAGRAGPRAMRHEAIADVHVYNVWNAALVKKFESTAVASGISDSNAADKALRKVGIAMARDLAALFKAPSTTEGSEPK